MTPILGFPISSSLIPGHTCNNGSSSNCIRQLLYLLLCSPLFVGIHITHVLNAIYVTHETNISTRVANGKGYISIAVCLFVCALAILLKKHIN